MQTQGHLQMVLRHVVEGHNPQAASDAPRCRINDAATLTLEHEVPQAVVDGLIALGHRPEVAEPGSREFGSAQLIVRLDAETAGAPEPVYVGGSDHRRNGQVVGC